MKIVKEEKGIKVVDFATIIDSKVFNFVKQLDYVELASSITFDKDEIVAKSKQPDLNTYLRLNFEIEDFEKLKLDFEKFLSE